jgi:N-acetylated-alpha-linked acidic dipeptidase
VAKLREPVVAGDPTSTQLSEQLPSYNAYSVDGDVTAPLVFVNYGVTADYEALDRMGISVKGKIVIAKYGNSWRGIKPKIAGEHGAIGCIIYSDPEDDGYHGGDVYPKGPMRPKDGVQRGSVLDMPTYAGDPLTPGVGATPSAKRLALKDAETITKIPVLPISYGDAQPLLEALDGRVAPREWQGGLPITYHVGAGAAKVHLKVLSSWDIKPAYDVIATLTGSQAPDEWVVRANHHDGWVNGAEDPISGLVPELEEARALGALWQKGWRPRRTIVYAAWDGEEPMLLGSTEWAEQHAEELKQKAVVYINTDGNGRGFLNAEGSHSLERFIGEVAGDIKDPETGLTVARRAQLRRIHEAKTAKAREEARTQPVPHIGALGSGSDFTPFLQHLGIAALNLGFGGEDQGGIYHSIYDDPSWYERFSDTSFVYGRALAQLVGTAVLRLADADVLPFRFGELSETVDTYITEVKDLASAQRDSLQERTRQLDEGVYSAVTDPHEPEVAPARPEAPPYLNFAPLENAIATLKRSASAYDHDYAEVATSDAGLARAAAASVNTALLAVEHALTDAAGLPKRPWYQHQLYAPGFYTGYGVKTLPGVREAIEQQDFKTAQEQITQSARAITGAAAAIDQATRALKGPGVI